MTDQSRQSPCSVWLPAQASYPPGELGVNYGAWHQKILQLAAAQSVDCLTTKAGGGIVAVTQVFGVSFICRDARRSTAFTCVVSCDFPCILQRGFNFPNRHHVYRLPLRSSLPKVIAPPLPLIYRYFSSACILILLGLLSLLPSIYSLPPSSLMTSCMCLMIRSIHRCIRVWSNQLYQKSIQIPSIVDLLSKSLYWLVFLFIYPWHGSIMFKFGKLATYLRFSTSQILYVIACGFAACEGTLYSQIVKLFCFMNNSSFFFRITS